MSHLSLLSWANILTHVTNDTQDTAKVPISWTELPLSYIINSYHLMSVLSPREKPMQKATLLPLYFDPGRDKEFDEQLARLRQMIGDLVDFADPQPLGAPVGEADAVILPQILGEAYRRLDAFETIKVPILIVTTEFGTLAMWDWEIKSWLASFGIQTIAPYSLEETRKICSALNVKKELRGTTFLIFQDNPGEGFQPSIFKRFYWWEKDATQGLETTFGVTIRRKSFKEFGAYAKAIPDEIAQTELESKDFPRDGLSLQSQLSAIKVYLALKEEITKDPSIRGMGINCLNESHFSDTTPCLAWDLLYDELGILWACEGDTMALMTKYLINKSLNAPIIMSNIYPFLMGQAALKHERIPSFPEVDAEPENYLLMAHCGYLGVCPRSFADEGTWTLRPKVLGIVDTNAHMIDARLPEGPCTLVKLDPALRKLMVMEGELTGYAQFTESDCLNGAVVRVKDGHRMMREVYSHHQCIMTGHSERDLGIMGEVFGLEIASI
jgi:hypothetical protein